MKKKYLITNNHIYLEIVPEDKKLRYLTWFYETWWATPWQSYVHIQIDSFRSNPKWLGPLILTPPLETTSSSYLSYLCDQNLMKQVLNLHVEPDNALVLKPFIYPNQSLRTCCLLKGPCRAIWRYTMTKTKDNIQACFTQELELLNGELFRIKSYVQLH